MLIIFVMTNNNSNIYSLHTNQQYISDDVCSAKFTEQLFVFFLRLIMSVQAGVSVRV